MSNSTNNNKLYYQHIISPDHNYHNPSLPPTAKLPITATATSKLAPLKSTTLPQLSASASIPTHSDMECVYKSQSPTAKTILITTTTGTTAAKCAADLNGSLHQHHRTSTSTKDAHRLSLPNGTTSSSSTSTTTNGTSSSSQQITIFTHHHHHASASAAAAAAAATLADVGRHVDAATSKTTTTAATATGTVGINILINNHFNEPASTQIIKTRGESATPDGKMMVVNKLEKNQDCTDMYDTKRMPRTMDCKLEPPLPTPPLQTSTTTVTVTNNNAVLATPPPVLSVGHEVFVTRSDGCFHLGTLVAHKSAANGAGRYLVRYADGHESWTSEQKVQPFGGADGGVVQPSQPMCVVCKTTTEMLGEWAHACVECGRAYHPRQCAQADAAGVWLCRRGHRNVAPPVKDDPYASIGDAESVDDGDAMADGESCVDDDGSLVEEMMGMVAENAEDRLRAGIVAHTKRMMRLPYELNKLTWYKQHHSNIEQTYCYCGRSGEWYRQMLQCVRCQQWFHEKCVADVLSFPLYCGDRFYVFACALCNGGTEFVRRQRIRLVDLVHLLLFNLHVNNPQQRYFDVAAVIVPYAIDNWHTLQLEPKMREMSVANIRSDIGKCLASHTDRFKSQRSLTLSSAAASPPSFALRKRHSPPIAPTLSPSHIEAALATASSSVGHMDYGIFTEKRLAKVCDKRSVRVLPQSDSVRGLVALGTEMRYTMSGRAYMKAKSKMLTIDLCDDTSDADDDDGDRSGDNDNEEVDVVGNGITAAKKVSTSKADIYGVGDSDNDDGDVDVVGNGIIAKTRSHNSTTKSTLSTSKADVYDYCSEQEDVAVLLPLRPNSSFCAARGSTPLPVKRSISEEASIKSTESNESRDSNTTTDEHQQQRGQHHMHKRKCRSASQRPTTALATLQSNTIKHETFTPPPPSKNNVVRNEPSLSGGGLLDMLIPSLQNFSGANNPFCSEPSRSMMRPPSLSLLKSSVALKAGRQRRSGSNNGGIGASNGASSSSSSASSTCGLVDPNMDAASSMSVAQADGTVRIMRTIKRRLSAKDLLIGPNMEVKRRKLRRGSCFVGSGGIMEVIHSHHHHQHPPPAAAAVVPTMVVNPMSVRPTTDVTSKGKSTHVQLPTSTVAGAVQTLANVNVPPPPPDVFRPAATYGIGGRRLRQRPDTNYAESGRRSGGSGTGAIAAAAAAAAEAEAIAASLDANGCGSRSNSTCSNGSTNSTLSAGSAFVLQPSVRNGLGGNPSAAESKSTSATHLEAIDRQANGKRFVIHGKRIGMDGQVQYLIDWD